MLQTKKILTPESSRICKLA